MPTLQLLKESAVRELFDKVPDNLELYRSGDFTFLLRDATLFLGISVDLDDTLAGNVTCSQSDDNELGCCIAIYNSLRGINPSLARDHRLWTRLSHLEFLDYSRTRWPIPINDDDAVSHIRTHFFVNGARGTERDNAISRLWWMSNICSKVNGINLEDALKTFLYRSDVRANIVERPTTAQNSQVLTAVVNKLHESYASDKALFEREPFRKLMKKINLEGGTRLIEVFDSDKISDLIKKMI